MDTLRESVDQSAIRLRLERAQDEIDRLSESRTNWRWSIPANPERDSDLILSDSVRDVEKLLTALAAERDRADRAEARLLEARKAMDANQTVDGVTDRGWLTPDEWLLNKVAEALGKDEATT